MAAEDLDDEAITGINVTPFVDVMLVLLVIFMVTANYISQQAISLQLPKATTGESPGVINLGFTLDKDAQLFLDGKPTDYAQIRSRIQKEKGDGKSLQALISADSATSHGAVIKLMDEVRKQGITEIAFNVEVDPSTANP